MLRSTRESAGLKHISGTGRQLKSRIVPTPTSSITTDPRSAVHYLVTEYGMVNLKVASTREWAEKIISIAHPYFREELIDQAEKMGIWRESNR